MKLMDKRKIWLVEWWDAHSSSGWFGEDEVKKFINEERCIVYYVGWILHETKDEIVLASRKLKWKKEGDPEWGALQKIPKAWIKKRLLVRLNETSI